MKHWMIVPVVLSFGFAGCMGTPAQAPRATSQPTTASGAALAPASQKTMETFTIADIATKNTPEDCYTAIGGKVYNLTEWIARHPGGSQAIISLCGTDGTEGFTSQHGGSGKPEAMLKRYEIGTLDTAQ